MVRKLASRVNGATLVEVLSTGPSRSARRGWPYRLRDLFAFTEPSGKLDSIVVRVGRSFRPGLVIKAGTAVSRSAQSHHQEERRLDQARFRSRRSPEARASVPPWDRRRARGDSTRSPSATPSRTAPSRPTRRPSTPASISESAPAGAPRRRPARALASSTRSLHRPASATATETRIVAARSRRIDRSASATSDRRAFP